MKYLTVPYHTILSHVFLKNWIRIISLVSCDANEETLRTYWPGMDYSRYDQELLLASVDQV